MSFAIRELSPARLGPRLRLVLARRPWVRWLLVIVVAALAGWSVYSQVAALDAARQSWVDRVTVPVAVAPADAGEALDWEFRSVPSIVVPDDVADDAPDPVVVRRPVGRGEIVVRADLAIGAGPGAAADAGEVVVPIRDPLVVGPSVGVDVAVYSDGIVLVEAGRIVRVEADVVFVAVDGRAAPTVAAAARTGEASIGFLGPR